MVKKSILILILINIINICGYSLSFSINLPGVSTSEEKTFGLWNVSILHEDDMNFAQIYTSLGPNMSFRILLANPNILTYQIDTPNAGFKHNYVESGILLVSINGSTNQIQCKLRVYGPWMTNFLNLPQSFLASMSRSESFLIQFPNTNTPPLCINTMGFESALKYAKKLQKNLKSISPDKIKFRPF